MTTQAKVVARKLARINATHLPEVARTALLVIDMQRSFIDPNASLYVPTAVDILPTIKQLVTFCRSTDIPVIFTQFVAAPQVPTLRKDPFGPEHLTAVPQQPVGWGCPSSNSILHESGAESPAIIAELQPRPDEAVIQGYTLDKFYGTPLDMLLRARDIRYLLITGLMADLCVAATIYSATSREYRVTAVTDGITTIWPDILKATFDIFERKLARLRTAAEIQQELSVQNVGVDTK
jgi:nicotinamidase-related amidase